MTLREFYKIVINIFNDGEPLPWKYTRKDGYWQMSKGFLSYDEGKAVTADVYLKTIKAAKEDKLGYKQEKKIPKHKFKVQNKYKGD